jgi:hypothetical protein
LNRSILDSDKLLSAFRGTMELPADLVSVYNLPGLFTGVLTEAIRLGISCVYLASALLPPDLTQPDRVAAVAEWIVGVENEVLLAPVGSPEFEEAFVDGQRPILLIELPGRDREAASSMRLPPADKEWVLFRIDQEWGRSL